MAQTPMEQAMAIWAQEADCAEITMGGTNGNFARVWIISSATAIGLVVFLLVPFLWCKGSSQRLGHRDDDDERCDVKPRSTVKDDVRRFEPNLEAAKRHLVSSSATVDGRFLNPFCTGISGFSAIGGTGTELYFTTLRTMGYLFAIMAALTFPTTAFCLLGTFAPDTGQFLVRASIGNLGLLVDTEILDPLLRIIRVGCDGANLADMTSIFAWLDLASMFIVFVYLIKFRFIEIPRRTVTDDLESVSVQDFAVEIDKLPARIEYQPDYASRLTAHLEERMKAVHRKSGKPGEEPQVAEVTLVRDYGGRLEKLQNRARMWQGIEVSRAYGKEKQVFKAEGKLAKIDEKLKKHLEPDNYLPVLRAFVILNRTADVHTLLYDYRMANFALFRCCQSRAKRFCGSAIRVRPAPQPTDILWENQDTPWWSRLLRQLCMLLTFIVILAVSLVAIYVVTVLGKAEAGAQLSYIGAPLCDPKIPDATEGQYVCFVNDASNWTRAYAEGAGGDILNCWCESQGYAKLIEDTSLVSTCTPWFLETAKGIGIMTAASCVVVVINLVLQYVLLAMARFERPLSVTALNKSMMQKIFLAQTLNTGFVLFIVNTYGPQVLRDFASIIPGLGQFLFKGPFEDLTRAWYVAVGATIMTNMLLNMVVPPLVTLAGMFMAKFMRCCCRGKVKHHSELIALYTNPEFDIKTKYAQMLTTVFVTLTYSAGLPLLYLFAFGYMTCMYWADKIALLWCSKRPPSYDAVLAKESSEALLYAIALHCCFAILMFGQPCVFPSKPIGGDLGNLLDQGAGAAGSEYLGAFWPKLTQESTWMFVAFVSFMFALWVFWWVSWLFQETLGTFAGLWWQLCCASRKVQDEDTIAAIQRGESVESIRKTTGKAIDIAATMQWPEAKVTIERCSPPASFEMEDNPDMLDIAHLMRPEHSVAVAHLMMPHGPASSNPEGGDLPVPQPGGESFKVAM